jgi:hypothetical protein
VGTLAVPRRDRRTGVNAAGGFGWTVEGADRGRWRSPELSTPFPKPLWRLGMRGRPASVARTRPWVSDGGFWCIYKPHPHQQEPPGRAQTAGDGMRRPKVDDGPACRVPRAALRSHPMPPVPPPDVAPPPRRVAPAPGARGGAGAAEPRSRCSCSTSRSCCPLKQLPSGWTGCCPGGRTRCSTRSPAPTARATRCGSRGTRRSGCPSARTRRPARAVQDPGGARQHDLATGGFGARATR